MFIMLNMRVVHKGRRQAKINAAMLCSCLIKVKVSLRCQVSILYAMGCRPSSVRRLSVLC